MEDLSIKHLKTKSKTLNELIEEGREGDAWAIIHEYEEWLDLHTDEDQDHDIYSLEYIGDDSEYD